jgi:hypothetical protein
MFTTRSGTPLFAGAVEIVNMVGPPDQVPVHMVEIKHGDLIGDRLIQSSLKFLIVNTILSLILPDTTEVPPRE